MNIFSNHQIDLTGVKAPEFPPKTEWFNSPPLTIRELTGQGKAVLVDFWTYSCINCQRTLPYLREWWKKYKDKGLVMIGVHTPEFEFEKNPRNLEQALKKYKVTWPVVLDNGHRIWDLYNNHFWPSEYLINPQGKIIYTHIGEGNYQETELQIQKALSLEDKGIPLAGQKILEPAVLRQTPELYCGYLRGALGNMEGYQKDKEHRYEIKMPEKNLEPDLLYLEGIWEAKREYIEHPRQTKELEDFIIIPYKAKKVYLVMESASGKPIKAYITLDSTPLRKENAGSDIKFESGRKTYAKSYVKLQFSTLYNLVDTPTFGDHILRISTTEKGLRVFAFTFGS